MAILFANTLGAVNATCIWRDPLGRGIAVKANVRGRATVIIGFHADSASDEQQRASFDNLRDAVPYDPDCEYVFATDANNVMSVDLDVQRSDRGKGCQDRPLGCEGLALCLRKWGRLVDVYRHA